MAGTAKDPERKGTMSGTRFLVYLLFAIIAFGVAMVALVWGWELPP